MTAFTDLKYPDPVLVSFGSPGATIFGELVDKHRRMRGRGQKVVANEAGCSISMISMVESGKRAPTKDIAEQIVTSVVNKPYYRVGKESDYFDICVMDPIDQHWRFFNFETRGRRDPKEEYVEKFELLRAHEKYKVLGYIDALIAERGE